MNTVWMCRYICGIFVLLFISGTLISFAPGAEASMIVYYVITGSGAFSAALAALYLNRLPKEHGVHRSKPLWMAFVAVTVTVIALMISVG